jgi:predicted ribosome-associated RNA-binding protein Tma20
MNRMEALIWILLPGFTAVASGLLAWFIMQSRMEVALALQRERMAETKGALDAEKSALGASLDTALRAAEAVAKQEALEHFMDELRVEQRHYTRENRTLTKNRKTLVLQERMYFRSIPLSDWVEHEVTVDEGADVKRLVQDMTIFDKGVVSIADAAPTKQLLA